MEKSTKTYNDSNSFTESETYEILDLNSTKIDFYRSLTENKFQYKNDKICCIELMNKYKINIKFQEDWTIKDVNNINKLKLLKSIFESQEFKSTYSNNNDIVSEEINNYFSLFDLHIILYRSKSDEIETKINLDIKLEQLIELGLIKYKLPSFYFKEVKKIYLINENEKNITLEILEYSNPIFLDGNLFPKNKNIDFLKSNPVIQFILI